VGGEPLELVVGNDGELYFTKWLSSKIGKMKMVGTTSGPPGSLYGEFVTPTGNSNTGITHGPDCNIWFTETNADMSPRLTRCDRRGLVGSEQSLGGAE
jgi:streptogramin lyase